MASSHPDARKWNARYREEGDRWLTRRPRPLLTNWPPHLPTRGLALDAAAGLQLAQRAAQADGLRLATAVVDLSHLWLPANTFDVIANFRFLERATFPLYRQTLKPGGWLIIETFVRTDPDYYLQRGELRAAFADWNIRHSAEVAESNGRVTGQLVVRRPSHSS